MSKSNEQDVTSCGDEGCVICQYLNKEDEEAGKKLYKRKAHTVKAHKIKDNLYEIERHNGKRGYMGIQTFEKYFEEVTE